MRTIATADRNNTTRLQVGEIVVFELKYSDDGSASSGIFQLKKTALCYNN